MPGGLMELVAYALQDVYFNNWSSTEKKLNQFEQEKNNWIFEIRLILDTDRNNECPVIMEIIKHNDKYCICSECKYLFSEMAITTIEKGNNNFDCPMCRSKWNKFVYFINQE